MSYQYEPTPKEAKAAERLRAKGWRVYEPSCPDCSGNGYVWTFSENVGSTATASNKPCPQGCPLPTTYVLSSSTFQTNTSTQSQ